MLEHLNNRSIFLASKSPRRKELLKSLNLCFEIQSTNICESYPSNLPAEEVAIYLALKKAKACVIEHERAVYITADTIVNANGLVLNKPSDETEARQMLSDLSEKTHDVHTGVCIKTAEKIEQFTESTQVTFNKLSDAEIEYYIYHFQPFDKAGSYGIQDWIGKIGISQINGCYYNVMGLPLSRLYHCLLKL